jgi:AraC-like DNA-binding protein
MEISIRHIAIHPHLRGLIEKIWILESAGRVPDRDLRLVVPNGMVKLIIPVKNEFIAQRNNFYKYSKSNQLTIVGINDIPFVVDTVEDLPFSTIGIEFSPHAAYRFFNFNLRELKNSIFHSGEVFGNNNFEIESLIASTTLIEEKVLILQQFLLALLNKSAEDKIFEYCIHTIKKNYGHISVKNLERKTGYCARWINRKFEERIGISPKTFCAIVKFQCVYQSVVNNPVEIFDEKLYYHTYYDQSHFIKEFKRFTGYSPSKFGRCKNIFGNISYLK